MATEAPTIAAPEDSQSTTTQSPLHTAISRRQAGSILESNGRAGVTLAESDVGGIVSLHHLIIKLKNKSPPSQPRSLDAQEGPVHEQGRVGAPILDATKAWTREKLKYLSKLKRKGGKRNQNLSSHPAVSDGSGLSTVSSAGSVTSHSINNEECEADQSEQRAQGSSARGNPGFILDILLHSNGSYSRRRAKMDTGAMGNLIAKRALSGLDVVCSEYMGLPLQPIGPELKPSEQVELEWSVVGREKNYTTTFCVIPDSLAGFDILLGENWIIENGALQRNRDICN
ncbi:hypothetical protein FQN54_000592 [Arachnomyces sp. PD_36]|nr:hypothetical protein FQN54_000592 [Arachnomyces sp. PD_36]